MDQDKSATQECYEFLDLSDVDDTERSQLATTLYPSEKQQAHVSWVHDSLQQHHHRQQQQSALGGFVNSSSEGGVHRAPHQQTQAQGDSICRQELEHDPAVINSWHEASYGQATATPLVRSLMPRLIPPLAAAAALPIYAIVKPTLAPLAAVPLSIPAVAGASVNGNNYEKTPSETETESSVTTDYTEFIQQQPPHHQAQHQQSTTEMSPPHSHHQHQMPHQQSQGSSGQQQMPGGQSAGGAPLTAMYSSGGPGGQPAYLSQGSHMYQMMQPSLPSNVYVSNVTANVNVHHSFMGPQMPQQYMQATAPAFIPTDVTPQAHDQATSVHQPSMSNMRMGGGGGSRRGRGNKSGGSHRRGGGGDYMSRQQQDQQQAVNHRQQHQQNTGAPPQQELMPPMMDPQQMMGAQGYAPQFYYQYANYYPPPNQIAHPAAQHAAGHPLYHAMPMYPSGHQMTYAPSHGMLMYPPAIMSPGEFAMIDDKGDDQNVMNDGSVGVMGQIWHPQMPVEYSMEPNMPGPQGHEDIFVQPDILEEPSALMMPQMISPQQTSTPHVLNPDVANFMTMEQQMKQAQQNQMMHQQMIPTDYVQNATKSVTQTSPATSLPISAVVMPAETTPQDMPIQAKVELQQIPQEVLQQCEVEQSQENVVAMEENIVKVEPQNNAIVLPQTLTNHTNEMSSKNSQDMRNGSSNILSNVTNIQNVPTVAPNNNNNVIKSLKQDDRLVKMTNDKLMIKSDRGQKPPAWNKKSTTSVSVTALPQPPPITTSQTTHNVDVKPAKMSPPPFAANQKTIGKALSNATAQVPKVIESYPKSPNHQNDQSTVVPTDAVAEKKTEVSTLQNKTVQAIPMSHQVNVDAKPSTPVTTFESKQVEVLPQIQYQTSPRDIHMTSDVTPKVTTNGASVEPSEKAKLETNTVATSTSPVGGASVVTESVAVVSAPPPSKSWASLFSSDNSTSSVMSGAQALSANKKPVAKVPPFEATQTLPIVGLSYSAASALGLQPAQATASAKASTVAGKSAKATIEDRCLKLGEFFSKYHIDNSSVILCPRGLTNRSNFCYINAILQALVACPPFYHMMKKIPLEPLAFRQKSSTPIIDAMVELVSEFSTMPPGARLGKREKGSKGKDEIDLMCDMAFEPTVIHKMLSGSRSEFHVEGRQEDAEEFLGFILNGLNDEMLEVMKLGEKQSKISNGEQQANGEVQNEESGDDWQVIYGNRNKGTVTRTTDFGKTPISDVFGGQLRSRVQREGDHSTDVIQPFFTLQLDIEKAESVKEALEILVVKDQLEGVTCSKTNQEVAAWQQVTLEKLPVVLILHLKWFDYKMDSCTKILKTVEFPIELRIDTKILSSKKCVPKQRQYKLFAVVYHDGKEASKGHYITDVFNIGYASWIRYDDSIVRSVSEQTVLHPHLPKVPYLLYYRRCDTIGPQSQSSSTTK